MQSIIEHRRLLTKLAIGFGSLPILSYAFTSYRGWLRLGPGGLPYNLYGWLLNVSAHLIARSDTQEPAPYNPEHLASLYGSSGNKSFFHGKALLSRSGSRPDVPSFVAPQRQMTEQATPEMLQKMKAFLATLANQNPEIIQLKLSSLEGPYQDALWLADGFTIPEHLKVTKGEFVHPHGEGSSHVTLSLADSAKAIALGWAERHKLSGTKIAPWGYVLIYAPRNENEFSIWKRIVVASVRFVATAGPAVRVPE
ncbi:uncharacterized protein BDZ99DRAFT_469663 [Mytilinidion resinicola]|uniref:Luciferase domain-containing protein n=1 Tax=Mytilinidion resinicola TaxID=574789 RepID=A0A6A6XYW8_9PEZI|nr:uncharacterized protein BDZ99DRAFT_469663 [Mytilinidion resinicola]KAF2801478.1 hypothetical protein BDZ99DRAFT_469663 [Mytilinidion resinicola]